MTYEEAMNLVAFGGVVTRGDSVIYISVNFASGMAGKTVSLEGFGTGVLFSPTEEDVSAEDWAVFTVAHE